MEKQIPVLYKKKSDCCGCGACMNICPRKAISMTEDECGFVYPEINAELCIRCGKCKKVCAFQNTEETNYPLKTVATVSKNKEQASNSASGGIFAAIAEQFISDNGVVYGAAFDEKWGVSHREVSKEDELPVLQGSKYVQSSIGFTYTQAKENLESGKMVLFSGTPCQIAGFKKYLGKEYGNLLTIDIICHGVPSEKIFQSYIKYLENKEGGSLKYFTFRDKKIGWGINGCAKFETHNGKIKEKKLWQSASSYLYYFVKGWIYRENCYCCKYAGKNRPGDITLGDYWGIEKEHPEYLQSSGWDENKGISVVIANSEKGEKYLHQVECLDTKTSLFEKAAQANDQLRHPSSEGKRKEILSAFIKNGWYELEREYQKNIGLKKYSSQIKAMIPKELKKWLKSQI